MKNTYFFMRHGQSLANLKHLVISDPKNGVKHYGLSALGKKQVLDSISKNKDLDKETIIYSSDFKRARESAEIVSNYLKAKKPILKEELRERHLGNFEKGKDDMYTQLWSEDLKGKTLTSVESVQSVATRVTKLIQEIEKTRNNKKILFVAHGDIISVGLTILNKKELKKHHAIFSMLKTAEIRKANK